MYCWLLLQKYPNTGFVVQGHIWQMQDVKKTMRQNAGAIKSDFWGRQIVAVTR